MDDFLHDLRQRQKKARGRGGQDKTPPKGRSYSTRKTAAASRNIRHDQAEQFKKIGESLESFADNQHLQIALDERIAVAQDKQAQALEALSGALTRLIDSISMVITSVADGVTSVAQQQRDLEPYAIPPNLDELKALSRGEVKAMIGELRGTGLSYQKIADKLNYRKIRTITGRGIWQGQTVYRLHLE